MIMVSFLLANSFTVFYILVIMGVIMFLISMIINRVFCRRPCHYVLPYRNSTIPTHCPGCGKDLNAKTDIND